MSTFPATNNSRCSILCLICRRAALSQIAHLAGNVSQAQLQCWQLSKTAKRMLAGVAFAASFEQVIEMG